MNTIDILSVNEFLGHDSRTCEICEHRQAAVLMIAHDHTRTAKAHVCLTCFELAESSRFDAIIESTFPPDVLEREDPVPSF